MLVLLIIAAAILIYLLWPDPIFGPIDDAAAIWLGTYLFVELCPPGVVREHQESLTSVIEGRFREVPDEDPPKQA